jgi:predicted nucleic acid-binding protein
MVLCDANLFYSILMTDLLLSLSEAGLFRPRWTKEIHEELIRNVLADQPVRRREDLDRRRALMDQAIDDDLIENYERHIENLVLPDPADRHVLAAAIEGEAEIILTYNLRDFPSSTLTAYGISALHPDEFLCRHMKEEPALVMEVIEKMRLKRSRPEISHEQLLGKLSRLALPNFVEMLRQASSSV